MSSPITYVTTVELQALKASIDERMSNFATQLRSLQNSISALAQTKAITTFPTEAAQIREKVRTAFEPEIAQLLDRLLALEVNYAVLNKSVTDHLAEGGMGG